MDPRTPDRSAGATTEFERDVVQLFLEAMNRAAKEERTDVGTESVLSALVSGDSAAGSAIAPGIKASGSLGGSIGARGTSVWISADAGDGAVEAPQDGREIDAFWREVRQEQAKRLRWRNRRKDEVAAAVELPPLTGALRACLRRSLETARQRGALSVRVGDVAYALLALPDTRAREAMTVEKLDISAACAALQRSLGEDPAPEPGSVLMLRTAGTFGRSGNPLTRKFTAWVFGGGAGFGSAVVSAVRAEALRGTVRRGAAEQQPVDVLLGILALDRALTVAGRELPGRLAADSRGAELLRRHGARQDALARVLSDSASSAAGAGDPGEVESAAPFERRLLHVTQFTASAQGAPTVGTTHLLAALLDKAGTDETSAAEVERVLTECGADVAALRAEPTLRVPKDAAGAA
ncbi:hypothetical protein DY218_31845 [Streptomyces triticagri]|uniref:Uncharacterized protein n=1 Tax=Streptomyces triticagri TaxID=2293568 RepID=A0A372LVE2_9ACTN|nr:Clp protease N-terminal domain-containing protein [Streptomyces triticagri]RFU82636.1 hypothetical protein DY218_31845 [Streptomyces triticagri]